MPKKQLILSETYMLPYELDTVRIKKLNLYKQDFQIIISFRSNSKLIISREKIAFIFGKDDYGR